MTNTTPEMKAFAEEAGLLPQDMPPANHPLFENDAEVRTLGDLVDARAEALTDDINDGDRDDGSTGKSDLDPIDDEDSYLTRADFEDSMMSSDPDAQAGEDDNESILGAGIDRAPDITGTVRGLAPGMGTHVPLDLGASGFQIVEPEDVGDLRANPEDDFDYNREESLAEMSANDPLNDALADDETDSDGHRIPIGSDQGVSSDHGIMSADDRLDGTRRLQ